MYEDFEDEGWENVNDDGFLSVLAGLCFLLVVGLVLFLLLYPAPARASDLVELTMPNDMGGEIVLTNQSCETKIPEPVAAKMPKNIKFYRAYATNDRATLEGCWFSTDPAKMKEAQAEAGDSVRLIPIVNIFNEYGVFTYHMEDFKPRTQADRLKDSI